MPARYLCPNKIQIFSSYRDNLCLICNLYKEPKPHRVKSLILSGRRSFNDNVLTNQFTLKVLSRNKFARMLKVERFSRASDFRSSCTTRPTSWNTHKKSIHHNYSTTRRVYVIITAQHKPNPNRILSYANCFAYTVRLTMQSFRILSS